MRFTDILCCVSNSQISMLSLQQGFIHDKNLLNIHLVYLRYEKKKKRKQYMASVS